MNGAIAGVIRGSELKKERVYLPFSRLAELGVPGGVPKGSLVEISGPNGSGKTEVALDFLSENPSERVVWIEESLSIYPCAIEQSRSEVSRILFIETGSRNSLWAVHQVLRSQAFGVVIFTPGPRAREEYTRLGGEEIGTRRLQLAVERCSTVLIMLMDHPACEGTWPMSVRLQTTRDAQGFLRISVLKYRGFIG